MEQNEVLVKMARECYEGASIEETVKKHLGEGIASQIPSIKKAVQKINLDIQAMQTEYKDTTLKTAVIMQVDKACGEDIEKQFRVISNLKYWCAMRNLQISTAGALDSDDAYIAFQRDSLKKIHEAEQQMAVDATPEELNGLRDELVELLPEDFTDLQQALRQNAENEGWAELLNQAEQEVSELSQEFIEDVVILSAATLMYENPELSPKEAAAIATLQASEGLGDKLLTFAVVSICIMEIGTLLYALTFNSARFYLLNQIGTAMILAPMTVAGALLAAILVRTSAKLLQPYVAPVWEKITTARDWAAEKVKFAISSVINVVANKVVHPVIYWSKESAIPFISEKIVHPLQRRLKALWDWIIEKKDQFITFVKDAAEPKVLALESPSGNEFEENQENVLQDEDEW